MNLVEIYIELKSKKVLIPWWYTGDPIDYIPTPYVLPADMEAIDVSVYFGGERITELQSVVYRREQ